MSLPFEDNIVVQQADTNINKYRYGLCLWDDLPLKAVDTIGNYSK